MRDTRGSHWAALQGRKLDIMEAQGKTVVPGTTVTQTEVKQ